jgi:hypothetical protein
MLPIRGIVVSFPNHEEETTMTEKFSEKVEQINASLRSLGPVAVQEIKMMKDGQVIGQVRYGYKPQYVFDAVNNILQPENWRYEIVSKEIFDFQAVVEVRLFIRIKDEWLCKGSQTGQMQIVKNNVGDAYKGAITDAIQKCLSLVSIGSDAYRGLLRDVYFSTLGNSQPQQTSGQRNQQYNNQSQVNTENQRPQKSAQNQSHDQTLGPYIDGVDYMLTGDQVVATGDTFNKKHLLKAGGFKWNGKNWCKEVAVH